MSTHENCGTTIGTLEICVVVDRSRTHWKYVLAILTVVACAGGGSAASKHWSIAPGSPPELQAVIDDRDNAGARDASLSLAVDDLKDAQAAVRKAKSHGHSDSVEVAKASARLTKAKARLAGLRNGTALPWPHFSRDQLKVGLAGYWGCASTYEVFQIIDGSTAILGMQDTGLPQIWVEHFDTTGMIDGKEIYASSLRLVFTATKTYDTAIGTKTVFVARSFSDDDFVYHK